MKKLLMPIFGGVLLTSSIGLTTAQNANTAHKVLTEEKTKTQEFLDKSYLFNKQSNLTKEEIKQVKITSQTWDTKAIDKNLNQALQYIDGKLIINKDKINSNKLPAELLQHVDLALTNLNNAVTAGFIKVNVVNDVVQLIYPNSNKNNNLKSSNNDIIDFGKANNNHPNNHLLTSSSYLWISTYGPSHWWRFWEWGAYIHFNEQAVLNAKYFNIAATVVSLPFIFKNIKELSNIINEMKSALSISDTSKINSLMPSLSRLLGGVDLTLLGSIADILAIFTSLVIFIMALIATPTWGTLILGLIELVSTAVIAVTNQMINADMGNGVKWQWANYVFPWAVSSE